MHRFLLLWLGEEKLRNFSSLFSFLLLLLLLFSLIYLVFSFFHRTFAPAIGSLQPRAAPGIHLSERGWAVIKRESGEKPEQSRCCKRLIRASQMVTDIFSGRPLASSFEDASQKTCRCHRSLMLIWERCLPSSLADWAGDGAIHFRT